MISKDAIIYILRNRIKSSQEDIDEDTDRFVKEVRRDIMDEILECDFYATNRKDWIDILECNLWDAIDNKYKYEIKEELYKELIKHLLMEGKANNEMADKNTEE